MTTLARGSELGGVMPSPQIDLPRRQGMLTNPCFFSNVACYRRIVCYTEKEMFDER